MATSTKRRVGLRVAASAIMLAASTLVAAVPGSAVTFYTYRAIYIYTGGESSQDIAFGRPTSFSGIQVTRWLEWHYGWTFVCTATAHFAASALGEPLGCGSKTGEISGMYVGGYLPTSSGPSCDATYSFNPEGRIEMGGHFSDEEGQHLELGAFPPVNRAQLASTDSCGYPPGNIYFELPLSPVFHVDIAKSPSGVLENSPSGQLTGFSGSVLFHSRLYYRVVSRWSAAGQWAPFLVRMWADQIGQWVDDSIDQLRAVGGESPSSQLTNEYLTSLTDGTVQFVVNADDPLALVDSSQRVSASGPTRLSATLSASALRALASSPGPVTLHITVTFTPDGGSPVTVSVTHVSQLAPEISSVTFAGSPSSPVVTVHGSSLGSVPSPDPATLSGSDGCPTETGATGADYGADLSLTDATGGWGAGRNIQYLETDCIGLIPSASSSTSLTLRLGSFYPSGGKFSLRNGDKVELVVNGAIIAVHVRYGHTVTS